MCRIHSLPAIFSARDKAKDELENFDETSLPEKEEFYSNLIMEDITDVDYMDAKRVCKDFEIKN